MSSARPEIRNFSVNIGFLGKVIQSTFMPNGNLLCLHHNPDDAYEFSLRKPETVEKIADSSLRFEDFPHINFAIQENNFGESHRLHPVSDNTFLLLPRSFGRIYQFGISDHHISYSRIYSDYYRKVFASQDQTLVGLRPDSTAAGKTTVDILNPESLKVLQTGVSSIRDKEIRNWTLMPSGRVVRYHHLDERWDDNAVIDDKWIYGHISIYNHPHDEKPTKSLMLREYVPLLFGEHSQAIAENILIYMADHSGVYFIHNLETDKIVKLNIPRGCQYTFAPVADNQTLIAVQDKFYLLDNAEMTLEVMTLNQNAGKRCTSIATPIKRDKDQQTIVLSLAGDDSIYFSNAPINKQKILGEIMAGIPKFSRDVAGVVLSYFGLGLFSGSAARLLKIEESVNDEDNGLKSGKTVV